MTIMVAVVFSSCSTTEKFYVSGTPNTKIYTISKEYLGTVGANGRAKIEISSDKFYSCFLSQSPNSELYVPFALDYEKRGRFREVIGATLVIMGLGSALVSSEVMAIPGLGAACLGLAFFPSKKKIGHEYHYQYLKNQRTNEDLRLTKAVFNEPLKGADKTQVKQKNEPKNVGEGSSVSKKRLSEKSSKTLTDYGKQTEGMYVGNGTLTQNSEAIESYNDVKVKIERISKNEAYVNVIADGEEFFESPSKYKITKNKNGSYTLKHSSISTATITISKNGSLTYHHPKINIDGELYVLQISAKE